MNYTIHSNSSVTIIIQSVYIFASDDLVDK